MPNENFLRNHLCRFPYKFHFHWLWTQQVDDTTQSNEADKVL